MMQHYGKPVMDQGKQFRKERSPPPQVMIEKLANEDDDNSSLEDSEPLDENQPRRYYHEANEDYEEDKESESHQYEEGIEDSEQDSADSIEEEDFAEFLELNYYNQDVQEYMVNIPLINVVNSNYQQLKRNHVFILEQIQVPVLRPEKPKNPRQQTQLMGGGDEGAGVGLGSVSAY